MNRLVRWLSNTVVLATVIVLATTVPFVATGDLQQTPHDTSHEIVVGVQGPGDEGYVVWYDSQGNEIWRYGNADSYHDVTVLDDGRVLTSYAIGGSEHCGPYPAPCGRTGIRIIDPEPSPHVDWQYETPVRTMRNSEIHDVEPHPDGFVYVDMDTEQIVVVNQSTKATRVLWDAAGSYQEPADETREDWLHINDLDRFNETAYLVSVRNRNQLLVVDTACGCERGVVSQDVRDGGVRKVDPTIMRGQHNPQRLDDGAVLVADSSNDRIVELHYVNGEWRPVWGLSSARGSQFNWPRDADRLPNGHTLITDSRNHRVLEVTESGTVVAVWETAKLPYEADAVAVGEPAHGSRYAPRDIPSANGEGNIPVIGPVYVGLQHALGLPGWVTQAHIVAWLLAFGLLVDGTARKLSVAADRLLARTA